MENSIEEVYERHLRDLTANNKHVITNLSILAYENVYSARSIARLVLKRLKKIEPKYKLPALYLIDSICKNGPAPNCYVDEFGAGIAAPFATGYFAVDEPTRTNFLRVLQTWHTVFDSKVIKDIEDRIFRAEEGRIKKARKMPEGEMGTKKSLHILSELQAFLDEASQVTPDIPDVKLDYKDIMRKRENCHVFLYDRMKLQCKTCGRRFLDDADGHSRFDTHLDCHFRRERQEEDGVFRSRTREWLLSREEWRGLSIENDAEAADDETEEVKVLSMPPVLFNEANPRCGVCNEDFSRIWDKDMDEWVILGAKRDRNNVVCHSECLQDLG